MEDCSNCKWSHPETCKACKAEELVRKTLEVAQQVAQTRQVEKFDYYNYEEILVFVN